ncbi:hypothetical protein HDU96_002262 [Phlyctochytrium bullatum]|nr:hypothetical protein HDU96_002262 [Phlyctochytrium bullatum]
MKQPSPKKGPSKPSSLARKLLSQPPLLKDATPFPPHDPFHLVPDPHAAHTTGKLLGGVWWWFLLSALLVVQIVFLWDTRRMVVDLATSVTPTSAGAGAAFPKAVEVQAKSPALRETDGDAPAVPIFNFVREPDTDANEPQDSHHADPAPPAGVVFNFVKESDATDTSDPLAVPPTDADAAAADTSVRFQFHGNDDGSSTAELQGDPRFKRPFLHTEELAGLAAEIAGAGKCPQGFQADVLERRVGREVEIPHVVHQIWAHHTNLSEIPARFRPWLKSWDKQNLGYTHIVFNGTTSVETVAWVREHFSEDVYKAFVKLPLMRQKAGLLKYLVLYEEGGVVADMDAECLRPVKEWKMGRKGVKVVLGKQWSAPHVPPLEGARKSSPHLVPRGKRTRRPPKPLPSWSLATWTLAAAPRHPFLHKTIRSITSLVLAQPDAYLADHPEAVQHLFGARFLGAVLKDHLASRGLDVGSEALGKVENCGIGRQYLDVLVLEDTAFDARDTAGPEEVERLRPLVRHHGEVVHLAETEEVL